MQVSRNIKRCIQISKNGKYTLKLSEYKTTGDEIFNKIKDANTKICWYYIRDCKEETGRVENKTHPLEIKTITF